MRRTSGFTLLEVLVAMTITALALGSLYSVIAGSKRLAWRAEVALARSVAVRNHINYTQLTDEQGDVAIDLGEDKLTLVNGEKFDEPSRKTWTTASDLRSYKIKDENGALVAEGSYWIREPLPVGANGGQTGAGGGLLAPGQGGQGRNGGLPGGGFPGANGGRNGNGQGQGGGRGFGPGNGGQFPGGGRGQFPAGNGGQFPGGGRGQFPGGQFPGGQSPGGQFPGGQAPGNGGTNGTQQPGGGRR